MLPTNDIILRWPSGKLSLTLQRGVQPQAVESVSMTISGGVMILHRTAEIFHSRLFRFHTYYQTRKILHQISAPLPTDES